MFRAALLPSQRLCGSVQDIRFRAAVDAMWEQFVMNLGGESLDNISLLAALQQPANIKEAIEATQGNPISTKLCLVVVVARMMFKHGPGRRGRSSSGGRCRS